MTAREYLTAGGIRIARWLGTLDRAVKREVQARVLRFERGDVGDHKSVGAGVWKARLSFGPGYRIYFGNDGDAIIVLLAGGPRLPRRRTLNGREFWRDYLEGRRHGQAK